MLARHRSLFLLAVVSVTLAASSLASAQSNAAPPSPAGSAPPAAQPAPTQPPAVTPAPAPSAAPSTPPSTQPPASTLAPAPAAPAQTPPSPVTTISPSQDQQQLAAQGLQRPAGTGGENVASPQQVYSEDWWANARPIIEVHGYFRTRAELFHNFSLNRHSSSVVPGGDPQYLWPVPLDQSYAGVPGVGNGQGQTVNICGNNASPNQPCQDRTESGANLRFRLNPEIHISDNLRIMSQIDLLDNLVLGSTPDSYAMQPGSIKGSNSSGYIPIQYNGNYAPVNYAPFAFMSTTQGPPTAGVNGWTNSIAVKRAWGEYMTPVGQVRFGRMPQQWGLGIVANAGDGIDSDYQSTVDRIMFITGIKSMDLYFGGAWDFVSTGPTNANPFDVYGGQPYNTCNLCNVNEWVAFITHRTNPEIQKLRLARGDFVLNGGLYAVYRSQYLDLGPSSTNANNTPWTVDYGSGTQVNNGLEPRQAWALIPDAWLQFLWRKFRFEAEAVTIQGQLGYLSNFNENVNNPVAIHQYGLATQTELRAVEDKLDLQFGFGWASGDAYANNSGVGALQPGQTGLQSEFSNGGQPSSISTFRFHPDYRIDLIFWRNIMSRVEGAYYFRPSVDYDFIRHADGEKFGGGGAVIWSRASEFEQTPGHKRDLGVELDLQLYYQSKDGSLNDDPTKIGGFYTMLQYGVFFPLGGLDYLPGQLNNLNFDAGLSAAQTVRLFLGIVF